LNQSRHPQRTKNESGKKEYRKKSEENLEARNVYGIALSSLIGKMIPRAEAIRKITFQVVSDVGLPA